MLLYDKFSRKINYLRLSVTDRCNMRCSYCMPVSGVSKLGQQNILSYEELFLLAQSAVSLGIQKIRVTGGDPLVRKGIIDFLGYLAQIPGLKQLVLTTNGLKQSEMAIQAVLRKLVEAKPARYGMDEHDAKHAAFTMAQIGG